MPRDREGELRLIRAGELDLGQQQRSGVEHGGQRRQPRLVVVLRAVVAQDGEGEVAFQQLGGPAFPLAEEGFDRRPRAGARGPQDRFGGAGRGAGAGVQQRDHDLALREGLIENREIADDDGEEGESQSRLDHRQRPAGNVRGRDVRGADGEKGGAAEVEIGEKGRRLLRRVQGGLHRPVQQREGEDQPDYPDPEQAEQRERPEDAQVAFAAFAGLDQQRRGAPEFPGIAVKESRQPEAVNHPPGLKNRFETVDQDAGEEKQTRQHAK